MASKRVQGLLKVIKIIAITIGFLGGIGFPMQENVVTGVQILSETVDQVDAVLNDQSVPVVDNSEYFEEEESETVLGESK